MCYVLGVRPDDEYDEITRPGTPDALRTMHGIQATLGDVLKRLTHICDALDRIERKQTASGREARDAKNEAARAFATAREAVQKARFSDKRIDSLVSRVQGVENGGR